MRINLQRFAFSTLTFSLATTLAVGGFSESANAQRNPSGSFDKSNAQPALVFDIFLEDDDGNLIGDKDADHNIGIFLDAIEIKEVSIEDNDNDSELRNDAKLFGGFGGIGKVSDDDDNVFNLSAKRLGDNSIEYQIYRNNDDIDNPITGIKFASIKPLSDESGLDFVNNLQNIIESSDTGFFVENSKGDFIEFNNTGNPGVLGLAINKSIEFDDIDDDPETGLEFEDFLEI